MNVTTDKPRSALERFHREIVAADDPNMVDTEGFFPRLDLYWHGVPNGAVRALINEARAAGVTVAVNQRSWPRSELVAARERVIADTALRAELNISLVGRSPHADGIDVGLAGTTATTDWDAAIARLQAVAGRIPVHVKAVDTVMDGRRGPPSARPIAVTESFGR